MLKVCHFTSVHTAFDGRIFYKECCSLAKAGYRVYLVAPNAPNEVVNGVTIIGVDVKCKGRLNRMLKTGKYIYKKALSLDADIYHFHDPELLRFALLLKRRGKKVIFDSHEFYGFQIREKPYLPRFFRNLIANLYMQYEAYVCRKIDAVIQVCTINGKDYFQNRCKKSIFITNVSDISSFNPNDEFPFEKRNEIILVGSLSRLRGVTPLVEAMQYTTLKLLLVGKFQSKEYEEEVKQLPGYNHVKYLGYIDNSVIPSILNRALVGMATLLNEGQYNKVDVFSSKVCEYMAMGIPIIMSNSPYNIKLNKLYQFGLCVNPANPKEIANAINYLQQNVDKAKKMGKNGREIAEKYFNWNVEEKKLLNLYTELGSGDTAHF